MARPNQRQRTRKDLLYAAARLMKQGKKPSFEEIAEAALVSRATAYRYFPGAEALLLEASLDIQTPDAEMLFKDVREDDPVTRLDRADEALQQMIEANESAMRMMLVHALQHSVNGADGLPKRQNRRTPLIEAALDPARDGFAPEALDKLTKALALVIGTEAMIVLKDVLQLGASEAQAVRRWAIRALVEAARRP